MAVPRNRMLWLLFQLGFYRPEDRCLLQDVIVQYYRGRPDSDRILFVGVARYVRHYPKLFPMQSFTTIDPSRRRARYGAAHHVVDLVQNLGRHFAHGHFDVIIMNGVIGYGINTLSAVEEAVVVCHKHLRLGGHFILSTDAIKPCHGQLDEVQALAEGFEPLTFEPLCATTKTTTVPWNQPPEHDFFFYQKKG